MNLTFFLPFSSGALSQMHMEQWGPVKGFCWAEKASAKLAPESTKVFGTTNNKDEIHVCGRKTLCVTAEERSIYEVKPKVKSPRSWRDQRY